VRTGIQGGGGLTCAWERLSLATRTGSAGILTPSSSALVCILPSLLLPPTWLLACPPDLGGRTAARQTATVAGLAIRLQCRHSLPGSRKAISSLAISGTVLVYQLGVRVHYCFQGK